MGTGLTLVLGGARSGKSSYALDWASQVGERILFVATAQPFDDEMRERVTRHQSERPSTWRTLEAPIAVGDEIAAADGGFDAVVVDCITLLVTNVLLAMDESASQDAVNRAVLVEVDSLLAAYSASSARWLLVSNEVGMGVVPPTRLGRFFRDALGYANQRLARAADEVVMIVAGLPWSLKRVE
jgi:adenosylcobinamide kinase/adenosylcobinamide-phosphate guanylyltransferase